MKRMKRWISMLLALSMLLSACPVSVYAETEETEAAVPETVAATEAVTEPVETMEATEPVETTEATEPEETTEVTEPEQTAEVTEPEESTEAAEPTETTVIQETVEITVSQEAALAADTVASGTCGTNLTWTFEETTGVLRISGTGAMSDYTSSSIPWYDYVYSIKSVVMEAGVTSIGRSAFSWCTDLTSVTIPAGVTSIGRSAFSYCINLRSVVIPEGVTTIGDYAFSNNPNLTDVTIPEGVTSIGIYAFYECSELTSVTIPASVTRIGEDAFYRCDSLTGIWVSPDNKNYSSDMSGVLFNKDQTKLIRAPGAISGAYICPETVVSISDEAFHNCTRLSSVTIPNGVTSIGNNAFSVCAGLASVSIGNSVLSIGESAFNGTALTSVTIPASVEHIGVCAFYNCSALTGIWVEESNAYYCNDARGVLLDKAQKTLIEAPGAISGEYTCPDSVTSIGSYAFGNCSNLKNVVLPERVSIIDGWAFHGCTGLTAVTIPASVTGLSVMSFNGCTNLEVIRFCGAAPTFSGNTFSMVTATAYYPADHTTWTESVMQDYGGTITWIPYEVEPDNPTGGDCGDNLTWELTGGVLTVSGVGDMDDFADGTSMPWYDHLSSITSVVLEDGVTEIGSYAFDGCVALVSVTIPASVRYIDFRAFAGCTKLTSVTIPEGVISIGSAAFEECTALASIEIPATVKTIGNYAFYKCGRLTGVTIPEGMTRINQCAFGGCSSLTEVTIPDSVTEIEKFAFTDCTGLTSVTIPEKVTLVDTQAFDGCTGLSEITFLGDAPTFGTGVFSRVSATVGYPADNDTWIEDKLQNYGGTLTWEPYGAKIVASGICGENLTWMLDEEGVLTISGTGDMTAYTDGGAPWDAYKDSVTALNLEEGITSIGAYAFNGCSEVTTVTVPDSVTTIHRCAFANMTGLMSVTLGKNLLQVGSPADSDVFCSPFYHCISLSEITFTGTTVPVKYGWPFTNVDMAPEATIYVPAEFYRAYAAFLGYAVQHAKVTIKDATEEFQIRDGVLEAYFGDNAEVTIPDTVTTIGYAAFNNNLNLTKVNLHDGVTRIENYAFSKCTNLMEIDWPENLTHIGGWSFLHCVGLKELTLPDSVTKIGEYAFSGCSGLTSATFGTGLQSIGYCAFWNCTALSGTLVIPDSVITIYNYAFDSCSNLTGIIFAGNAPTIKSSAFDGVRATVRYPANDETWTEDKLQKYGGTLTWVPYCNIENSITLDDADLTGQTSVWIDGVEYAVQTHGELCYVALPDGEAKTMVAYTYQIGDASDIHTQYPVSMQVWTLSNEDGIYTASRVEALDDILQYSGSSIRLTGRQGIRMITSMERTKKNALVSDGLAGYTLKEYGTVVAWASQMADQPLVLGSSYAKSSYAYKKGIADPVFAYEGDRMQYTNVLVGFSNAQCKDDLAMRPYMILADAAGNEITLYGGIVYRSIGYIAWQNRNVFAAGTEAYEYVWEIIHNVYGNAYDEEYTS